MENVSYYTAYKKFDDEYLQPHDEEYYIETIKENSFDSLYKSSSERGMSIPDYIESVKLSKATQRFFSSASDEAKNIINKVAYETSLKVGRAVSPEFIYYNYAKKYYENASLVQSKAEDKNIVMELANNLAATYSNDPVYNTASFMLWSSELASSFIYSALARATSFIPIVGPSIALGLTALQSSRRGRAALKYLIRPAVSAAAVLTVDENVLKPILKNGGPTGGELLGIPRYEPSYVEEMLAAVVFTGIGNSYRGLRAKARDFKFRKREGGEGSRWGFEADDPIHSQPFNPDFESINDTVGVIKPNDITVYQSTFNKIKSVVPKDVLDEIETLKKQGLDITPTVDAAVKKYAPDTLKKQYFEIKKLNKEKDVIQGRVATVATNIKTLFSASSEITRSILHSIIKNPSSYIKNTIEMLKQAKNALLNITSKIVETSKQYDPPFTPQGITRLKGEDKGLYNSIKPESKTYENPHPTVKVTQQNISDELSLYTETITERIRPLVSYIDKHLRNVPNPERLFETTKEANEFWTSEAKKYKADDYSDDAIFARRAVRLSTPPPVLSEPISDFFDTLGITGQPKQQAFYKSIVTSQIDQNKAITYHDLPNNLKQFVNNRTIQTIPDYKLNEIDTIVKELKGDKTTIANNLIKKLESKGSIESNELSNFISTIVAASNISPISFSLFLEKFTENEPITTFAKEFLNSTYRGSKNSVTFNSETYTPQDANKALIGVMKHNTIYGNKDVPFLNIKSFPMFKTIKNEGAVTRNMSIVEKLDAYNYVNPYEPQLPVTAEQSRAMSAILKFEKDLKPVALIFDNNLKDNFEGYLDLYWIKPYDMLYVLNVAEKGSFDLIDYFLFKVTEGTKYETLKPKYLIR